jgi:hypothetical protein
MIPDSPKFVVQVWVASNTVAVFLRDATMKGVESSQQSYSYASWFKRE